MIGRETDPPVDMCFFNWWRFSLSHRLNPFITHGSGRRRDRPGVDDLRAASIVDLGPAATHGGRADNLRHHSDDDAAARSIYSVLLCRRVTWAFWPSALGGYVFGFSPYTLGQADRESA
jgi:hypothetical protein